VARGWIHNRVELALFAVRVGLAPLAEEAGQATWTLC
jgi:hypothetical protein